MSDPAARDVPMVSIIICSRNRSDMLSRLLTSLELLIGSEIARGSAEIVVLDDASTDATAEVCAAHADSIRYQRSSRRIGTVEARRRLMRAARGDYLVQLDNDSFLLDHDALDHVRRTFAAHPACAIIAANVASPDHPSGQAPTDGHSVQVSDFVGCGAALRASVIRDLGGYPSFLADFYAEETALSLLALHAGHQVLFDPGLRVYHAMDATGRNFGEHRGSAFANEACIVAGMYPYWFILPALVYKAASFVRYNTQHGTLRPFMASQKSLPCRLWIALTNRHPVSLRTIRRFYALRSVLPGIREALRRSHASTQRWPKIV